VLILLGIEDDGELRCLRGPCRRWLDLFPAGPLRWMPSFRDLRLKRIDDMSL
jgi:hypothetical protein